MANYGEAARRHFADAKLLGDGARVDNADQLYGVAAECALKGVMVCLGLPVDSSGSVARPYRTHNPQAWRQYATFAANRVSNRYPISGDPFADWDVNQRYDSTGSVDSAAYMRHRDAAKSAVRLIDQVRLDGYRI